MLPVFDHDGLKSMWPVVSGFPSGLPDLIDMNLSVQVIGDPGSRLAGNGQQRHGRGSASAAAARVVFVRNSRRRSRSLRVFMTFSSLLVEWRAYGDRPPNRSRRSL